jgi:hypothetical protein
MMTIDNQKDQVAEETAKFFREQLFPAGQTGRQTGDCLPNTRYL